MTAKTGEEKNIDTRNESYRVSEEKYGMVGGFGSHIALKLPPLEAITGPLTFCFVLCVEQRCLKVVRESGPTSRSSASP